MFTPEDLIFRFDHMIRLEKAKEENTDDWPEYQHRGRKDEVEEEDVQSKKRKRTEEPDGYDKELHIPHYYICALPDKGSVPSVVHDVLAHRK
jgi:hypothetical protein